MMPLPYDDAVVHVRREILSSSPIAPICTLVRCVYPAGLVCDWHSKNTSRRRHVILALSGGMALQERGQAEIECEAGCVLIIPQNLDIRWTVHRETATFHCLHSDFDFKDHGALASLFGAAQKLMTSVWTGQELALKIDRSIAAAKASLVKDVACSVIAFELLWATLEAHRSQAQKDDCAQRKRNPLRSALDFIEGNLHQEISLEDLMESSGLGASRLSQLFRENLGMPPLHYVTRRKVEAAERLLSAGDASVGETAEKLGFKSLSYFSRVFKRQTGRPPSKAIAIK